MANNALPVFATPTFDAAAHVYRYKGRIQTGASQLLAASGLKGPVVKMPRYVRRCMEAAASFGSEVHEWTAMWDQSIGDPIPANQFPAHVYGHVKAWGVALVKEHAPKWTHIEQPMCCPALGIAGTPDRIGADHSIWDLKTGIEQPWHRWQLAVYAFLVQCAMASEHIAGCYGVPIHRVAVYLHKDGRTYHARHFDDPLDMGVIAAAITLYNTRKKFGLLEGGGDGEGVPEEVE